MKFKVCSTLVWIGAAVCSAQTATKQPVVSANAGSAVKPPAVLSAPATDVKTPPKPEALRYNINWASGLSLGEATISASKATLASGEGWLFTLKADASVPGFTIQENANSSANMEYCAIDLEKQSQHGKYKVEEKTTFDSHNLTATRETLNGGGKSDITIPACAKEALGYVFYLRRELAHGRLPAAQKVFFGSPYDVRPEYTGTEKIKVGEETIEADHLVAHVKGPKSDFPVDVFLSKDASRLPLVIRVPVAQGKISMELVR